MKRAIVTGGAGFIGSHLVDLLVTRDYHVTVIDNLVTGRLENLSQHAGDLRVTFHGADVEDAARDPQLWEAVDYVFHLAGIGDIVPSIERPLDYMRANVSGTLAVLEATRRAKTRKLVYAASSSCYGVATEVPTTEGAPIQPEYPYALSKYMGELAVMHWAKINDKPLTVVGDGTQTRDFVFVTDVAEAYLAAAESSVTGEIFNIGAGKPQSVNRLVELIGGEVVHVPKRPAEPDCTWADIRKIESMLGWRPVVTFEDGVAAMLRSIDAWKNAPLWTPEKIADATRVWFEHLGPGASRGGRT